MNFGTKNSKKCNFRFDHFWVRKFHWKIRKDFLGQNWIYWHFNKVLCIVFFNFGFFTTSFAHSGLWISLVKTLLTVFPIGVSLLVEKKSSTQQKLTTKCKAKSKVSKQFHSKLLFFMTLKKIHSLVFQVKRLFNHHIKLD